MKTQILGIRLGNEHQYLNTDVDYSGLKRSTQHSGHAGSNHDDKGAVWANVMKENPYILKIRFFGEILELKEDVHKNGRSGTYRTDLSDEFFDKNLKIHGVIQRGRGKFPTASLIISSATPVVFAGRNGFRYVCPSFIEIL